MLEWTTISHLERRYYLDISNCAGWVHTRLPVVKKVLAAVRTLDRFGISDRAGAAIVSAALQDVGIISESNVLNVVDKNKIRRGRTKARTALLSQVIKDYDHNQFGLYFDGRKDRTLSMEDNRRKVIKEEHISLVKEPGSEYIGHVSFRKIHEDSSIPNEDKFQYHLQAVVPESKAAREVESFPATADNYPKAISQLQERFGRDDLLVQIYMRDLLSMVMKNAVTGRSKTDLPALYDELEAKLRALESLGRTKEKYGDFLSPLLESFFPEEVLVAWERSRNHSSTVTKESRTLEQLMNFLRQEVKGEEIIN
ncbi:hypothetical protein AVEN_68901-1 [Araneus ventricosus]|uniref:Uncharacterized protein n=1 Tax=Araneus ventricosus TaxID=182803 RepID=A0A4Y2C7B8_ARAVE|nr:hypothetical protein AVEN_68901-1 [Araneus ventricosus]